MGSVRLVLELGLINPKRLGSIPKSIPPFGRKEK